MPKIFNTNILGILCAAIAGYMIGYLWYGGIFMTQWQTLTGMSGDGDMTPMMFVWGFALTLAHALGLAAILQWRNTRGLLASIATALIIAFLFIIPTLGADTLYQKEPLELLMIDGSHALVTFAVMGATLSFFRRH